MKYKITIFCIVSVILTGIPGLCQEDELESTGLKSTYFIGLSKEKRAAIKEGRLVFNADITPYTGSDNNVFRSPNETSAAVESDSFSGVIVDIDAYKNFSAADKLKFSLGLENRDYSTYGQLNENRQETRAKFTHELNRDISLSLQTGYSHKNNSATNIYGKRFTRDFEYRQYEFGIECVLETAKWLDVRFEYDRRTRDYSETALLDSLDWMQDGFSANILAHKAGVFKFRTGADLSLRSYEEDISYDKYGKSNPQNPLREINYLAYFARMSVEADDTAEFFLDFKHSRKIDGWQGYEDYGYDEAELGMEFAPAGFIKIEFGASVQDRGYRYREGDNNMPLAYVKNSIYLIMDFAPSENWRIFLQAEYLARDTNKTTGTSNRDYNDFSVIVGAQINF